MLNRPLFVLVVLSILPLTAYPLFASSKPETEPIGRVTAAFGIASVYNPNGERKGDLHTLISNGDRIETNGGGVTVLLASRVVVKLDHDTTIWVTDNGDQVHVALERGTVHMFVGERPSNAGPVCVQDPQVRAETLNGVFLASYDPASRSGYYACEHSNLTIEPNGKGSAISLAPERQVVVENGKPGDPQQIDRLAFAERKQSLDRLGQTIRHQGAETFRMRTRIFDTEVAIIQLSEAGWLDRDQLLAASQQRAARRAQASTNSDNESASTSDEPANAPANSNNPEKPTPVATKSDSNSVVPVSTSSKPAADNPNPSQNAIVASSTTAPPITLDKSPVVEIDVSSGSGAAPAAGLGNIDTPPPPVEVTLDAPRGTSAPKTELQLDLVKETPKPRGSISLDLPPDNPAPRETFDVKLPKETPAKIDLGKNKPGRESIAPAKIDLDFDLPAGRDTVAPAIDFEFKPDIKADIKPEKGLPKIDLDKVVDAPGKGKGRDKVRGPKIDLNKPGKGPKVDDVGDVKGGKGKSLDLPLTDVTPAAVTTDAPKIELKLPTVVALPKTDITLPKTDLKAPAKIDLDPKASTDAILPKLDLKLDAPVADVTKNLPTLDVPKIDLPVDALPTKDAVIDLPSPKDLGLDVTKEITTDVTSDVTIDVTKDVTKEVTKDVVKDATKDRSGHTGTSGTGTSTTSGTSGSGTSGG